MPDAGRAEARGEKLGASKAEQVAVLYACAESLTPATDADRTEATERLNALIAVMTARDWQEVPKYWGLLGSVGMCGLMRYAVAVWKQARLIAEPGR